MSGFRERLRRTTGEVVLAGAALMPASAAAQQESLVIPKGEAGAILMSEKCGTINNTREPLYCNTDHASLRLLNDYIKYIKATGDPQPQTITVRFPLHTGNSAQKEFSIEKLEALTAALETKKLDKNYHVIVTAALTEEIAVMGDKGDNAGVIAVGADIVANYPVAEVANTIMRHLEKFKNSQRPGIGI